MTRFTARCVDSAHGSVARSRRADDNVVHLLFLALDSRPVCERVGRLLLYLERRASSLFPSARRPGFKVVKHGTNRAIWGCP
jgi:hypothetical protein